MVATRVDVLILGAGFGGSLLAAILANNGRTVALVDRAVHPRFAIGESSTPLADAVLERMAKNYGLSELLPLTRYGTWKKVYPQLACGLKTGFSYFGHQRDCAFSADDQLVVAASDSVEVSDTHWLRSDVDEFLFGYAKQKGATCVQGADYVLDLVDDQWSIEGTARSGEFAYCAPFVVDATGVAGEVMEFVGVPEDNESLKTNSSAMFAHFEGVASVASVLSDLGIDMQPHPFNCDAAAVHQVLADGWMWQLRFDDDTVSAGILVNGQMGATANFPGLWPRGKRAGISGLVPASWNHPQQKADGSKPGCEGKTPLEIWNDFIKPYPFIAKQFRDAKVVRPASGIRQSGRLQRIRQDAAGRNWAALAGTSGFIDPLHSTGIAHTLFSVNRIASLLLNDSGAERTSGLQRYSETLLNEIRLIDELVEGCYSALPSFRLWSAWCMLYFAAVTSSEHSGSGDSFLLASDGAFRSVLDNAREQLQSSIDAGLSVASIERFEEWLRSAIRPWNYVGLMDPAVNGMYRTTAAPKGELHL